MLAQRDKPRKRKEKPETPFARDAVIEVAAQTANKRILLTLACCLAFFVAIPALIYYLSYIPYFRAAGGVSLERVVQAAQGMLEYHSEPGRGADHPFASPWYEWPLCLQPIFYHQGKFEPFGMAVSITALGNLAIWWGGLLAAVVALCVMIWRHVRAGVPALHTKENDMRPALLLISYAAQFVPWMFVPRGTYIYHYFTSVPFIILCIALCFDWLYDVAPKIGKWAAWGFIALAAAVFIAYFPYASGVMAPISWMEAVRIFQNWIWY